MNILSQVVLVPTYNPQDEFIELIEELQKFFKDIVIVNDGSDEKHKRIFNELCTKSTILEHKRNMGKGAALKTGFRYIRDYYRGRGVITADSDGQHLIKDIISAAHSLESLGPRGFVLGEREFFKAKIPFCSAFGNYLAAAIIRRLFNCRVKDTQTGLRGIGEQLIDDLLNVSGERYEYETNVLLRCLEQDVAATSTPIEAVYNGKTRGHFRKLRDTYLISLAIIKRYVIGLMTFLSNNRCSGKLRQKV